MATHRSSEPADLLYALIGRPTAKLNDGNPPSDFEEVLRAEYAMTAEYRTQGVLRELWLFADRDGALLLCEAETLECAQAISAGYPMVKAGFITHEIHALQPGPVPEQPHGEAG